MRNLVLLCVGTTLASFATTSELDSALPSVETSAGQTSVQSEVRSSSWLSSWWSTAATKSGADTTSVTELKTEVQSVPEISVVETLEKQSIESTQSASTLEKPVVESTRSASWFSYNPLSFFWRSNNVATETASASIVTEEKELKTEDETAIVPETGYDSFKSRANNLESLLVASKPLKVNPNVEKVVRVRTFISRKREHTADAFNSFGDQVALRARMMLGKDLDSADLVAEHRISRVALESVSEEILRSKNNYLRRLEEDEAKRSIQAAKKGNLMGDLQARLLTRRLTYDTQYSTEGSKSEVETVSQTEVELAPVKPKVQVKKGVIPQAPVKKEIDSKAEKTAPTKKEKKSHKKQAKKPVMETTAGGSSGFMDELKIKLGSRKKDKTKTRK